MNAKEKKLKPRVIECLDRLRSFIDMNVPAVVIGAAAWHLYTTVLATYGDMAASTMVQEIRERNLHQRAVCSYEDCTNYVDRPTLGMCGDCLKLLDLLPTDAEVIT